MTLIVYVKPTDSFLMSVCSNMIDEASESTESIMIIYILRACLIVIASSITETVPSKNMPPTTDATLSDMSSFQISSPSPSNTLAYNLGCRESAVEVIG